MVDDERSVNDASGGGGPPGDDSIARLMRLAGPRPSVPQDVRVRVHASARKEWRKTVTRRRALRWAVPVALAATVVLAVLGDRLPPGSGAPVATVAMADGKASAAGAPLAPGDPVYVGDSITTGADGVALTFENGLSLRLDARTTATVEGFDEVSVMAGRVYADTGTSVRDDRVIAVHTSVGSATDHGTQFAVGYGDGAMTVAVREGSVDVSARRASYTADAGQRLTLEPGHEVVVDEVPPFDDSWAWAASLAPAFDIHNRPVFDFLRWVARETGRELVFADDSVRLAAMASKLRGSISGFTPSEAVEPVLSTTRFHVRVDDRERMIVTMEQ
jgi:ferric-dicitrate binding protein FerR (iron transport regulator)